MDGKYYITHYVQASKTFLLPLVELSMNDAHIGQLLNTYLYWEDIDDDILDNKLIVEYTKGIDYGGNENTIASYSTKDSDVLIYDLSKYSTDVEKFLNGQYSKFSDLAKLKILEYVGFKKGRNPKENEVKNWHTILYPERYVQEVIGDFVDVFKYYDNKEDAGEIVKGYREFFPHFDLTKETLTKKRTE